MRLLASATLALGLLLTGCNKGAPQNNEAVKAAVADHVTNKAGLNLSAMDVNVVAVSYKDNEANATVRFVPKTAPEQAQDWNYTLESVEGKWQVKGKATLVGGNMGGTGSGSMPQGHPPVSGQGAQGQDLPAGHPPVAPQAPGAPTAPTPKQ